MYTASSPTSPLRHPNTDKLPEAPLFDRCDARERAAHASQRHNYKGLDGKFTGDVWNKRSWQEGIRGYRERLLDMLGPNRGAIENEC